MAGRIDVVRVEFDDGLPRIQFGLERWSRLISDWTPFFDALFRVMEHHFRQVFATEGEITGEAWQALNERYAEWKARKFPGRLILHRTGRMKDSLTQPRAPDAIRLARDTSAVFGTETPYARYHQFGGGRLPKRPILRFSTDPTDRTSLVNAAFKLAQAFVVEARRRALGNNVEDVDVALGDTERVQRTLARILATEVR